MGEPTPILKQEETDTEDIQIIGGTAEDEKQDADLETKDDEDTTDKTKPDETDETGDKKDEKPAEPNVKELLAEKDKEIIELRTMVRQQARDHRALKDTVETSTTSKDPKDPKESDDEFADLENEDDKKPTIDVEAINERNRETQLDTYLETMRISDKYGDVDDVIALNRFDDTVEMLAETWIENNSDNTMLKGDVIAEVEKSIWSQKNPYRYMYDVVKKMHPDFAKDTKTSKTPTLVKGVVPSVNNMDGAHKTSMAGWTAARIDALPEGTNLHKDVPPDVYELYMKEELK